MPVGTPFKRRKTVVFIAIIAVDNFFFAKYPEKW